MKSIQKYATDTKHRENVKAKTNKRYKVDKKNIECKSILQVQKSRGKMKYSERKNF